MSAFVGSALARAAAMPGSRGVIEGSVAPLELASALVIRADVFGYDPPAECMYDTIYFDIWNDIDPTNRREMRDLRDRYSRHLRDPRNGWIGSWREEDVQ